MEGNPGTSVLIFNMGIMHDYLTIAVKRSDHAQCRSDEGDFEATRGGGFLRCSI
jgi:hypothetical protein